MQLVKEQIKEFETFISKLEISKVRSDIQRMWDGVKLSGYVMRSEQLDELKDFAIHLPLELQSYPQIFSNWVKNREHTEKMESDYNVPKKSQANLGKHVKDSHKEADIKDKNIEDKSVAPTEDKENKAAKELLPKQKQEQTDLVAESKKGDLHRDVSAMSNDTPVREKPSRHREVVIEKKESKKQSHD